jgi:hypothetical protein
MEAGQLFISLWAQRGETIRRNDTASRTGDPRCHGPWYTLLGDMGTYVAPLPLVPGDELRCPHCRQWHPVTAKHADGAESTRNMLYWRIGDTCVVGPAESSKKAIT